MTETDLANVALGHLGTAPIMSINQASPEAEHCRRMWNLTRDALLRQRHWNFALKRAALPKLADKPAFGWANAFELPEDYILAVDLNGRRSGTGEAHFDAEGDRLLCNEDQAELRYVRRVINVAEWDASFCQAFSYQLAAAVAPALSAAQGMADRLLERGQQFMLQAFGPDNLETRPQAILAQTNSAWMAARLGGSAQAVFSEPLPSQPFPQPIA